MFIFRLVQRCVATLFLHCSVCLYSFDFYSRFHIVSIFELCGPPLESPQQTLTRLGLATDGCRSHWRGKVVAVTPASLLIFSIKIVSPSEIR